MSRFRLVTQACLLSIALFAVAAIFAEFQLVRPEIRRETERLGDELRREAHVLAAHITFALEEDIRTPDDECLAAVLELAKRSWGGRRLTVVDAAGKPLADTHKDVALMENHVSRPEFVALGQSVERLSRALDIRMTYVAEELLANGERFGFVRVAVPSERLTEACAALRRRTHATIALAGLVGLGIALLATLQVARPLEHVTELLAAAGHGDVDARVYARGSYEVRALGRSANRMLDAQRDRMGRLRREQLEKDAILAGMTEGVVAVDEEQRVVLVNAAAREMLGAIDRDPRGQPIWEVTRVPEVVQTVAACIRDDRHLRVEARLAGDEPRVLELAAAPLSMRVELPRAFSDPGPYVGTRQGCVLVLHDVSELRRLEQVRRDFVANVSHELKTPLTAMRGYLETVLDDPEMPDSVRTGFLQKAERNTERLAAIVSDLLTLARAESPEGEPEREAVDLAALAQDCVADVRPNAEVRLIRVELELPDEELWVHGDQQLLGTAIRNLLDNAVKYSPEESDVWVRLGRNRGEVWLEVVDQGPGIPLNEQERVFERFYRIDKDRSRQLGGTGLGLSIVRNVLVAHGGDVSLESAPGRGSRFRIRLPGRAA